MKILSVSQIRNADLYTIAHEPIASIDLMERASKAFARKFLEIFKEKRPISIFCGKGNNGGDGLAIGRVLMSKGWHVSYYLIGEVEKGSEDFKINLKKCSGYSKLKSTHDFPTMSSDEIVIDGIFGSGLSRPLEGITSDLVAYLNGLNVTRISIDIASGLFADLPLPEESIAFTPEYTISFQVPKLVFFLPKYYENVGEWHVVDIGLDQAFISDQQTSYLFSDKEYLAPLIPRRSKHTHKSEVGKVLLVAGSKGKVGAAALAANAAFRAGAGLVTVYSPSCGTSIITTIVPEAMVIEDEQADFISSIPKTTSTVGIGPGLGTEYQTQDAFLDFIKQHQEPLVLDADALNILALHKSLIDELPEESILTPHPGEFQRLVGDWENDFDKIEKLRSFCQNYRLNLVLKGAYSTVCNSRGIIHFNPSGNAGMATAGSGDVLTGIVTSLLAQGLKPFDALILGVYIHGLAGDLASEKLGENSMMASDIISNISNAFKSTRVF